MRIGAVCRSRGSAAGAGQLVDCLNDEVNRVVELPSLALGPGRGEGRTAQLALAASEGRFPIRHFSGWHRRAERLAQRVGTRQRLERGPRILSDQQRAGELLEYARHTPAVAELAMHQQGVAQHHRRLPHRAPLRRLTIASSCNDHAIPS